MDFVQNFFSEPFAGIAVAACVFSAVAVVLLLKILRGNAAGQLRERQSAEVFSAAIEKAVRDLRDDAERTRTALEQSLGAFRAESAGTNQRAAETLQNALAERSRETNETLHRRFESFTQSLASAARTQTETLDAFRESQRKFAEENRASLALSLEKLREENSKKLDEMRGVVDEKLQTTLEKRLGESFRLVSERLESVHKSLGEMQSVAADMGDLKNILANVKTRGTWGETQLDALLSDMLAPEQFARNVKPNPRRQNFVEFAVKLPGNGDSGEPQLWLPIDAKFPKEDYERLVDASRAGKLEEVRKLSEQICRSVETFAHDIRNRYICPPFTTNFAILFLPTEGLFAEVLRNPGFSEKIRRELGVLIAGPTTLAALLNSLQAGFRTLAVRKNSAKIAKTLVEVRGQFEKFAELLEKLRGKLEEAQRVVADTTNRHRIASGKLEKIEALPEPAADGE